MSPDIKTMQLLLDHMSTAVCLLDEQLKLVYFNPAAENTLQLGLQRHIGEFFSQLGEPNATFLGQLGRCLFNQQPFTQREVTWIVHDEEITVDINANPIVNLAMVQGIVLEFSEVDRILQIARDEKAIGHVHAQRALIRGLAHEVKNPLSAIRGATQLLRRCIEPNLFEYTDVVIAEVDRLKELVDAMLGPRTPLKPRQMNVHEAIERVIRLLKIGESERINGPAIAYRRDYDLSLPEINGDLDRLIQALLNIGKNACQALWSAALQHPEITFTTRIERQMTLHHQRHRLVLRLTISDNGPGIDTDLMSALFYPLVSGRADGSGIGLSIAQHILQQHGGVINCESRPGATAFHLLIPASFLPNSDNNAD